MVLRRPAARAARNAPKITLPWLAVHGEADKVCPISGSRTLIDTLGSRDKQLVTYPNLLHEVHNEDETVARGAVRSHVALDTRASLGACPSIPCWNTLCIGVC